MHFRFPRRAVPAAFLLLMAVAGACFAADDAGVTSGQILIGRVSPLGSPVFGAMAKQRAAGADAYIASINAKGGVSGRRIVVRDRDDQYDAIRAAQAVQSLIEGDKVFALLGAFGTPTLPTVIRHVVRAGVPLVGAASISDEARQPVRRFVFPVRVSANYEAVTTVKHQATIGSRRFTVLSSKEAFGPSGARAYADAVRGAKLPLEEISFSALDDPKLVAERVKNSRPDVLLLSVVPKFYAPVAKEYRALRGQARMFGLSVIRIEDLHAELGQLAEGMALSQAVPWPLSRTSSLAVEYRAALSSHLPSEAPSYQGMEGFLEAKVLVEGLRRARLPLTRQSLIKALETFRPYEMGDVSVHYGPETRSGSTYTELIMLGANGQLTR